MAVITRPLRDLNAPRGPARAPSSAGEEVDPDFRRVTLAPVVTKKRSRMTLALLAARVAALEERLARLESGRAPPGDGRAAAVPPRRGTRCPGCGLPLRRRAGRCAACGRPLDSL